MVDAIVAIMIAAAAMVGGARYYYQYLVNQIARSSAQQMSSVSLALSKYMQDNYGALLAQVSANGGLYNLPITTLEPIYLSPDFVNKNPYGQQYIIAIRQPVAGVNKLDALVYTSGGQTFSNQRGQEMSAMVGSSGGYVDSTSTLKTTYDGWTTSLASYGANPGPGHLVDALFYDSSGALEADYLYRDAIPGRPELNKMDTAIDMGGNNINNAGQVGAGSLVVSGATSTGSLAVSESASVGANLNVVGSIKGATVSNGNLTMTGSELVGASGDTYLQSPGANTLYLNPWNSGQVIVGGGGNPGNLYAVGNSSANTIAPRLVVSPNTSCSGYAAGAMARDGAGNVFSCTSGLWKQLGGGSGICPDSVLRTVLNGAGTYQITNTSSCSWQFFAYQNSNKGNTITCYIDGVYIGTAGMSDGYSVNGYVSGVIPPGSTFRADEVVDGYPGQVVLQSP